LREGLYETNGTAWNYVIRVAPGRLGGKMTPEDVFLFCLVVLLLAIALYELLSYPLGRLETRRRLDRFIEKRQVDKQSYDCIKEKYWL
jgi:membrane protein DedA with SNARE-associated domain